MSPGAEQEEFVSWLAWYLARKDAAMAATYVDHFENLQHRRMYEQIVQTNSARANPRDVLDRLLASGRSGLSRSEIYGAMRSLAGEDVDAAMLYLEQVRSPDERRIMQSMIAQALVNKDIDEALAWVNRIEGDTDGMIRVQVLQQVARKDPDRAFAELQGIGNQQIRINALSNIISTIADGDPVRALGYVEDLPAGNMREQAVSNALHIWMRQDADAALSWILSHDELTANRYLERSSWAIVRTDPDAAIRLLPRISPEQQQNWRFQIAQNLAQQRSPAEAMGFISQYEGEPGYTALRTAIISSVAERNVASAWQMAEQMPDRDSRDAAFAQIIQSSSRSDPQSAAQRLAQIADEAHRSVAASAVVSSWARSDPAGATNWVTSQPPGPVRDNAIVALMQQSAEFGPAQERLIDSIGDEGKRTQARIRQIYTLMRRDPVRARQLLEQIDVPAYQRQEIEIALRQMSGSM
jgi:hypothetical protein